MGETWSSWLKSLYILPAPEALVVHQKNYRMFAAAQDLKRDSSELLNTASDGWVPPYAWEVTLVGHKEMHTGILEAVLTSDDPDGDDPIRNERDLREIWPFDLDLIQ